MSAQRPKGDTLKQLRRAALKRWRTHSTPGAIARRLEVPEWWIQEAIRADVAIVCNVRNEFRRATATQIASMVELPRSFVVYVMARTHGRRGGVKSGSRSKAMVG